MNKLLVVVSYKFWFLRGLLSLQFHALESILWSQLVWQSCTQTGGCLGPSSFINHTIIITIILNSIEMVIQTQYNNIIVSLNLYTTNSQKNMSISFKIEYAKQSSYDNNI